MATFEQGQINAGLLTEKEMAIQWKKAVASYEKAIEAINWHIEILYAKKPDFTKEELQTGALRIWAEKNNRLNKLKATTISIFNTEAAKAGRNIITSSELAINNTYYREQYTLKFFADYQMPFTILDPNVIEASVYGTFESWSKIDPPIYGNPAQYITQADTITDLLRNDRNVTLKKIQQAITTGLTQGLGVDKMTRNIRTIIGGNIKRGEAGYRGLTAKSARIARTEGTRNLNAGYSASQHQAANQGIEQKKRWVSSIDERTRETHINADNQEIELDGVFSVGGATGPFPGQMSLGKENYNCRCTTISIINGIEPSLRRGVNPVTGNPQVFSYKSFPDWAAENGLKRSSTGKWIAS